jgi:hypothetical protein
MSARRLTSGVVMVGRLDSLVARLALSVIVIATLVAVLAGSALGASEACPNAVFRTGFASHLPDCRAYEMVTPPYKEGFRLNIISASADGSVLTGKSNGLFAGVQNAVGLENASYTVGRGPSGWRTFGINLSAESYPLSLLWAVSADGGSSLWSAATPSQVQGKHQPGGYAMRGQPSDFVVRGTDGSVADVGPQYPAGVTADEVSRAEKQSKYIIFVGASADLSSILFAGRGFHWPGDPTEEGKDSLYEYVGRGNSSPLLVGVSGGFGSRSVISSCGTELGPNEQSARPRGAMSEPSGAVVFFTARTCGSSPPVNELFARVDNGSSDAHTVAISEPTKGDCEQCDTEPGVLQNAEFAGASADGSKVFFTTSQPLLGGDATTNIYEYDFDNPPGQRIVRVSGGDSTVSKPVADVGGILEASSDGSFVYFVGSRILTTTPNSLGQIAEADRPNLYVFERDVRYPNGRTAFIASAGGTSALGMSTNGRFFTFLSAHDLTLDDTSVFSQGFEYDAQTGGLVRFTIGQNGYNDNGNASNFSNAEGGNGVQLGDGLSSGTILSSVADDGAVFFSTLAPLTVQAALNGESESVYEYREGNVYLISASPSSYPSKFLGADSTGTNVFFETREQLLPQDGDTQLDVYDARVDGGFQSPAVPSSCEGDGCQGGLSGAPVLLSPGSEFQAGGNPPLTGSGSMAKPVSKVKKKPKKKRKSKSRKAARAGRSDGRSKRGRK